MVFHPPYRLAICPSCGFDLRSNNFHIVSNQDLSEYLHLYSFSEAILNPIPKQILLGSANLLEHLGKQIERRRIMRGLTISDLENQLGLNKTKIFNIEHGGTSNLKECLRIIQFLKIPIAQLLDTKVDSQGSDMLHDLDESQKITQKIIDARDIS